jgi:hypothetical protein
VAGNGAASAGAGATAGGLSAGGGPTSPGRVRCERNAIGAKKLERQTREAWTIGAKKCWVRRTKEPRQEERACGSKEKEDHPPTPLGERREYMLFWRVLKGPEDRLLP